MKLGLLVLTCLTAGPAWAETALVGPKGQPNSLRQAIEAAADGDVIELLPGEYAAEAIQIPAKRLTLRGIGPGPVFRASGKMADAKGIIAMQGGTLTVENIEFRGARASDANGAGIHLMAGRLTVLRCRFIDNETAILTSNDATAELHIDSSVFSDAPKVVGGLYHLLHVGRIGVFSVNGSRFHHGFEGHLLKSRARESRITYNLIVDGPGGEASYEIDLPNGGEASVIGNVIGQAAGSQNPVVVAFGAEGNAWPVSSLTMAHNTLINDKLLPAWFLRTWPSKLPLQTPVVAVNNLTVGGGLFGWGASGRFEGNAIGLESSLVDTGTFAFELTPGSRVRGTAVDPRSVGGRDLSPKAEFALPTGTRALAPPAVWSPGAFQGTAR